MSIPSLSSTLLRSSTHLRQVASTSASPHSSRCFSSSAVYNRNLPSRRPRDPLASDPSAIRHHLPTGETLIIRPPPSVQSPYNLEQSIRSSYGTTASDLDTDTSILPPSLRPSVRHSSREKTVLSANEIGKLQSMRRQDPTKYTTSSLAKLFNASPLFVSIVAPLPSDHRKLLNHQMETQRANWGSNKSLQRILRKERKALW